MATFFVKKKTEDKLIQLKNLNGFLNAMIPIASRYEIDILDKLYQFKHLRKDEYVFLFDYASFFNLTHVYYCLITNHARILIIKPLDSSSLKEVDYEDHNYDLSESSIDALLDLSKNCNHSNNVHKKLSDLLRDIIEKNKYSDHIDVHETYSEHELCEESVPCDFDEYDEIKKTHCAKLQKMIEIGDKIDPKLDDSNYDFGNLYNSEYDTLTNQIYNHKVYKNQSRSNTLNKPNSCNILDNRSFTDF